MHPMFATVQISFRFLRIELADALVTARISSKVLALLEHWLLIVVVAHVEFVPIEILQTRRTS